MDEYNVKAINDAYKNAHIALQSISDLLPEVEDKQLKKELQDEYEDNDYFFTHGAFANEEQMRIFFL
jgi:hypothetical protein